MRVVIVLSLILAAVLLMQRWDRDASELDARLAMLEARIEQLSARLEQRQHSQPLRADPSAAQPAAAGSAGKAVTWRLGARVDGEPLRVAAESLDRARDQVELLLEVVAPLADAEAWPQQPGQRAPLVVIASDSTGTVIAETPMRLLRGSSREPGAYLHVGAQLPPQAGARVHSLEVR